MADLKRRAIHNFWTSVFSGKWLQCSSINTVKGLHSIRKNHVPQMAFFTCLFLELMESKDQVRGNTSSSAAMRALW